MAICTLLVHYLRRNNELMNEEVGARRIELHGYGGIDSCEDVCYLYQASLSS